MSQNQYSASALKSDGKTKKNQYPAYAVKSDDGKNQKKPISCLCPKKR